MESKLARPRSLTELAVERIRASIVEGRLALGEQLSEAALASRLGISKTPVREALLALKLDGLVEIHPQRGTFVFRVSEEQVAEICRFREILESAALAEAMARDAASLAARLEANVRALAHARRSRDAQEQLPQLDAEFHGAILDGCGNSYLRAAYRLIEHKIHALRWRLPENSQQVEHCEADHGVIADQIRKGNVTGAQATLRRHIGETKDTYLQASRLLASTRRQRA
jgi:DNA-binding GntR family transcriptional regulator